MRAIGSPRRPRERRPHPRVPFPADRGTARTRPGVAVLRVPHRVVVDPCPNLPLAEDPR
jgi:hypothetical protein